MPCLRRNLGSVRRAPPITQAERLLASGDAAGALLVAEQILSRAPDSPLALSARARALLMAGRDVEGEIALDRALAAAPGDPVANTVRANLDALHGMADEALERLRPIVGSRSAQAPEALLVMLDILFHVGRSDEWRALLEQPGPWRQDPRAMLHAARRTAEEDAAAGVEALTALFRAPGPPHVRRRAGFEAVTLLDCAGEYRTAFDLAREVRHATDGVGDPMGVFRRIKERLERTAEAARQIGPLAPLVSGVAMVCALPRSGTTLLMQMLDRHPLVSGIGEFGGIGAACSAMRLHDCWPARPGELPPEVAVDQQRLYLAGAARRCRPGARWTLDKSLRTWQSLAEVAAVLPGAACISVERDPRDMAISLHLTHFAPGQQRWSSDFACIRHVIELSQRMVPRLLEALRIPHVTILYERLVEDPAGETRRALALLALDMDDRVAAPEGNPRAAMTESTRQVRRPVNRSSIGRWENYAFAFDDSWSRAAGEHDRRLANQPGVA